jgi:hypothetical protein
VLQDPQSEKREKAGAAFHRNSNNPEIEHAKEEDHPEYDRRASITFYEAEDNAAGHHKLAQANSLTSLDRSYTVKKRMSFFLERYGLGDESETVEAQFVVGATARTLPKRHVPVLPPACHSDTPQSICPWLRSVQVSYRMLRCLELLTAVWRLLPYRKLFGELILEVHIRVQGDVELALHLQWPFLCVEYKHIQPHSSGDLEWKLRHFRF